MVPKCRLVVFLALVIGCGCAIAETIPGATTTTGELFEINKIMIPMRDGVRLQTVILVPKNQKQPLPLLFSRSPYGVPDSDKQMLESHAYDELMASGYIFVFQNLRGRYKSEGQFVMIRPPRDHHDPKAIDESTDAYDTIDWLVKNVPNNNGRVGMVGISYAAWTTVMALLEPHPALKAVSEQGSPASMYLGDDFHHNGAFRLSYGFEYVTSLETTKEGRPYFRFDTYDTYEWYLKLGGLSNANALYFHEQLPTWNDFVNHPNYDEFWKKQAVETFLRNTTVPNLNVAGWWDQEDFYGPLKIYGLLEKTDADHLNYIVAGPWNHGGWSEGIGRSLGGFDFGRDTAKDFRAEIQAPWFAFWLHRKGPLKQPEAMMFQTGTNRWQSYDAWPPVKGIQSKQLYFRAKRKLSFEAPKSEEGLFDSYVSDPANPVPYRPRPITSTYPIVEWSTWLLRDQRFTDHRPDVFSWETEPLMQDLVVTGDVVANLFASTSGTDGDWVVKLIDVFPEDYQQPAIDVDGAHPLAGYQLMIANEVFRGRFRNGFEKPQPLPPNQPLEYKIDLHAVDHAFLKGHKIMVQVQSTWFPLIDRNPQKFVPNIFMARDSDYVKATQRIYRTPRQASAILLPVVTKQTE